VGPASVIVDIRSLDSRVNLGQISVLVQLIAVSCTIFYLVRPSVGYRDGTSGGLKRLETPRSKLARQKQSDIGFMRS
jgi:hypothetical protein